MTLIKILTSILVVLLMSCIQSEDISRNSDKDNQDDTGVIDSISDIDTIIATCAKESLTTTKQLNEKTFTGCIDYSTSIIFYKNGKLHRKNGPAVEGSRGDKEWWINGKRHRTDGPAVEFADGTRYWYLNGREYNEEEYWVEVGLQAWGLSTNA